MPVPTRKPSRARRGWAACFGSFVFGLLLGCSTASEMAGEGLASAEPREGVELIVNGEPRDMTSATIQMCAEGLPELLTVNISTTRADCPELSRQGPAATQQSRGRLCEELSFRVPSNEIGMAITTETGTALVRYARHEAPSLWAVAGDSGADTATGSVTLNELTELADRRYRMSFSIELNGGVELRANGAVETTPTFCTSA